MPTTDDLSQSKYLRQADVEPELVVTIKSYTKENVAKDNEPPANKYCLEFAGDAKPLVLNKTNGELIAMNLGSKDLDDWIGKQITLYVDPTISFGGNITGGIRVRYFPPSQFTDDNELKEEPPFNPNSNIPF